MPQVPAVCNNCGSLFPSGINLVNSTNVSISDGQTGPCPRCQGTGKTLNGIYDALGDSLTILIDENVPASEIQILLDALKAARNRNAHPKEIREEIERRAPQLKGLLSLLKDRENRKETYIIIGLIIALLANYLKSGQHCPPSQINNFVEQVTVQAMAAPVTANRKARRTQQSKARHK